MDAGPVGRDAQGQIAMVAQAARDAAEGGSALDADGDEGAGVRFEQGGSDCVEGGGCRVGDVEGAEGVGC